MRPSPTYNNIKKMNNNKKKRRTAGGTKISGQQQGAS